MLRASVQQTLIALAGFAFLGIAAAIRRSWGLPHNPYIILGVFVVGMVVGFVFVTARALPISSGVWNTMLTVLFAIAEWCICVCVAFLIWANIYGT